MGEARKSMMEGDEESGTPLSDNSDISPILRDEMPTLAMEQIAPNFPELSAIPSIEPTLGQLQQQQYDLSGDGTDEDDDDPERESLLDDFLKKKKQGGLRNSIDTLDGQNSLNIDVARDKRSKFNRASTGVIGKTNKKEGSPMFQV